jgi:hypothetical protein
MSLAFIILFILMLVVLFCLFAGRVAAVAQYLLGLSFIGAICLLLIFLAAIRAIPL